MSIKETERLAFIGRVVFYGALFYMGVLAFQMTGVV